jgi:hypothetical protein
MGFFTTVFKILQSHFNSEERKSQKKCVPEFVVKYLFEIKKKDKKDSNDDGQEEEK